MSRETELGDDYGTPRVFEAELPTIDFPPVSRRKHGEVCMAIRRKDGRFLLHTKGDYPDAVMRLPSGGIKEHEGLKAALLREVWEETNLEVEIEAFVAVIGYHDGTNRSEFKSYLFLVHETGGEMMSNDPGENITEWREVTLGELPAYSRHLLDISSDWKNWGRFRATAIDTLVAHCRNDPGPGA